MSPHLGQPPADGDDRAQDEFAGTAGGTAASGADRALTAGSPERGEGDDGGPAEPGRDTNQAGQGASSSRPAAGGADRIWHSPAAGLPTPAPSGPAPAPGGPAPAPGGPAPAPGAGANRPREGGTAAAPSKPATGGTYRVLTGKIVGLSRPATDGAERTGDGGTAAPSNSDPGSSERPAAGDTAALRGPAGTGREARPAVGDIRTMPRPGTGGEERTRDGDIAGPSGSGTGGADRGPQGDPVALPRRAAGGREARPAVGDLAGSRSRGSAANGEADAAFRTAPNGAYAPLIGDAAALRANWRRVQADFVDDPRAAVSDAADLVEHAAQALIGALRQRQKQLRGSWDGPLAGGAGAAPDGGSPIGGRLRGVRPRRRVRRNAGRHVGEGLPGTASPAADGAYRAAASASSADLASPPADDGWPDAEIGAGLAAGAEIGDATEQLRLVMQRYRSLFNQICRP